MALSNLPRANVYMFRNYEYQPKYPHTTNDPELPKGC